MKWNAPFRCLVIYLFIVVLLGFDARWLVPQDLHSGNAHPPTIEERIQGACPRGWPYFFRVVDGRLQVFLGNNPEGEKTIRDIWEHPGKYGPVIEKMISRAVEKRQLQTIGRVIGFLVLLVDTPRTRAFISRHYLDLRDSEPLLLEELANSTTEKRWKNQFSWEIWALDTNYRAVFWRQWLKFENRTLKQLTLWHFRSLKIRDAALETLMRCPDHEARVLGENWSTPAEFRETMVAKVHAEKMKVSLEYLETVFAGDREVRNRLVRICQDPESALNRLDYCGDDVERAIRILSRSGSDS